METQTYPADYSLILLFNGLCKPFYSQEKLWY